jgi:hypothetical protein
MAHKEIVDGAPYPEWGTKMNVWQIGQCMYELIMRGRAINTKEYWRVHMNIAGRAKGLDTYGIEAEGHPIYSATLRKLVMRCLAFKATDRPTPDEMLEICEGATAVVKKVEEDDGFDVALSLDHQFWEPDWLVQAGGAD